MSVSWEYFQANYFSFPKIGLAVDLSRVKIPPNRWETFSIQFQSIHKAMADLEAGAIANQDEKRMVGHYWLRAPDLAPNEQIRAEIRNSLIRIKDFAQRVHEGSIAGERGPFKHLLLIGIGGSALGPQFVSDALGHPTRDKLSLHTFDNTDPDGMDKVLSSIITELGETLCVVISKSGGTRETRNGMLEAENAYRQAGLEFSKHAVAVTGAGSELDRYATANKWVATFPMWDWVGGRTSETSAVGLLPAALQGFDIDLLLKGAKECDEQTRNKNANVNPSALLCLAWLHCCNANAEKNMVILPYKDRLQLFSKYLQQLIMESIGKEFSRDGKTVHQGISVFGNKGSTDQHAYIQQLRDGPNDFFATFILAVNERNGPRFEVEPGISSGDYLNGFYLGTREALFEKGRESVTLRLDRFDEYAVGLLIALFERAVGFYAEAVNINAYHQPGVEAGKKAATKVLEVQSLVMRSLQDGSFTVSDLSSRVGAEAETVFHILEHLTANPATGMKKTIGKTPFDSTYHLR